MRFDNGTWSIPNVDSALHNPDWGVPFQTIKSLLNKGVFRCIQHVPLGPRHGCIEVELTDEYKNS